MTVSRLPGYLNHMRQAIADALLFTEGMAQSDFERDKRTQQAVVMSLIVLGEAATKIMDQHAEFVVQHAKYRGEACAACATASRMVISTSTWPWFGTHCKRLCPCSKFNSIPSFLSELGSGF